MKHLKDLLNNYQNIGEGLKLGSSKIKLEEDKEVLNDILYHFEFDNLYKVDKDRLQKESYINETEGSFIKKALLDFINKNDIKKNSLKYYTGRNITFINHKVDKDYKKSNPTVLSLSEKLRFADDNKQIFKKNSLFFEVSAEYKMIGMYGPLGGVKICYFGK